MALFKILRGSSANIDTTTTPFHDGYAYFTPDDGGFYIDAVVNGNNERIRINPDGDGSTAISATLTSSGWSSGRQTVAVTGVTANSNGVVGLAQSITDAQMEAAKSSELYISEQGANTITITAFNGAPSVDIPIVVILVG